MSLPRVFDQEHYKTLNASRAALVACLLGELKEKLGLRSAIDVGCGLGYFAGLLSSMGFDVVGLDGRSENADEAQRRFPKIRFHCLSAEDPEIVRLGLFDLVFCFGLVYHLENPFLAIRNLSMMTKRLLLVEGVMYPGDEPSMTLIDEGSSDDQGLCHIAFYPTEACLVKMLYRAGFPCVYEVVKKPDHPDYHELPGHRRNRAIFSASRVPLDLSMLAPVKEPISKVAPWDSASGVTGPAIVNKMRRFLYKQLPRRLRSTSWRGGSVSY